jgi:hypothetical protein
VGRLVRSVLVITFKDSLQRILVDSHIPTADDVHKNESEKFGRAISTTVPFGKKTGVTLFQSSCFSS